MSFPDLGNGTGMSPEDVALLDEIVADAMRMRALSGWTPNAATFAMLEATSLAANLSLYELLDEAVRLVIEKYERFQPPL